MLKILFISDTHGFHNQLTIEKDTDIVIHSGDASNSRSPYQNLPEMIDFLNWYESLQVKYKVFVAGNHDTSIANKLIDMSLYSSVIYLEHSSVNIEGLNIFGSPYTPEFGEGWAFNVRRDRLYDYWKVVPNNTDILVTHGPPKGILDIGTKYDSSLEYCGDLALWKKVKEINPRYHSFGHIHNNEDNVNSGIRITNKCDTHFVNASCVTDGQFQKGLTSQGYYITIKGAQSEQDNKKQ